MCPARGVQVRAAGRDGGEPGLVIGVKAAVGSAELADVAFDGLHVSGPAQCGGHFGVQGGGAGDALVPPLADVRLERVELAFPAGGLDQQPGGIGLGRKPVHGVPAQVKEFGAF